MEHQLTNANLTLGMQLLEDNRTVLRLLAGELTMNSIASYEALVHRMDCLLAGHRDKMRLEYFDSTTKKIVKLPSYEKSMELITKQLDAAKDGTNNKPDRLEYVKWLNHWAQLHFSVYESLRLQPPRSQGKPDTSLVDDYGDADIDG